MERKSNNLDVSIEDTTKNQNQPYSLRSNRPGEEV